MSSSGCPGGCPSKQVCLAQSSKGVLEFKCVTDPESEGGLSSGAIIGIVVSILAIIAIVIITFLVIRVRKRRTLEKQLELSMNDLALKQADDPNDPVYGIQSIFNKAEVDHLAAGIYSDNESHRGTHMSTKISSKTGTKATSNLPTLPGTERDSDLNAQKVLSGFNHMSPLPQPGSGISNPEYQIDSMPVKQDDRFHNSINL